MCVQVNWWILIPAALGILSLFLTSCFKSAYVFARSLPRDLRLLSMLVYWNMYMSYNRFKGWTLIDCFYRHSKRRPNDIAMVGIDGKSYTYKQFEDLSSRLALYFDSQRIQGKGSVALIMESCPEYILVWYSLAKIKIITSFINTNLKYEQLMHSITISKASAIIYSKEMESSVKTLDLSNMKLYCFDGDSDIPNSINIEKAIQNIEPIDFPSRASMNDILCYIFTSGSTGLPKAAIMRHSKALCYCQTSYMVGIKKEDVIYSFMPLYHINSGIIVVGGAFHIGFKLVIRKKFSTTNFIPDCYTHQVTVFNYVGEVCRYLLNSPPSKLDSQLKLRLIMGNGLRASSWCEIMKRFNIERIVEFYGSSEGNAGCINLYNRVGACGYYPPWSKFYMPFCLVRCDNNGEIIRDSNNRARICDFNEVGHMIGKITKGPFYMSHFDGYVNQTETQKKVITDVFRPGDRYYLSGDLLKQDEEGFLYFIDRLGDTFRWKGENVSTNELETYLMSKLDISDAIVYGVQVPHHEGRAGMVSICGYPNNFEPGVVLKVVQNLPSYQRPVFVRLLSNPILSGTMKFKKFQLKVEGFNIQEIADTIYVLIPKNGYVLLTPEIYQQIISGKQFL